MDDGTCWVAGITGTLLGVVVGVVIGLGLLWRRSRG